MKISEKAWCHLCDKTKSNVLVLYPRYDINVCAECMEKALATIENICPNCRSDRTGKASLIYMGSAFCDNQCFEEWKSVKGSLND